MRRMALPALVGAALSAAALPAGASAHRIEVFQGDSIRHAVKEANPGDAVIVHPGKYRTHLKIDKKINLVGVGSKRPIIDAGCQANDTIKVTSPGVTVTGFQVQGADMVSALEPYPAEVYFDGVMSGKATDLRTIDTCDAEYGVSVFNSGPVKVTANYGKGFSDSAIYIGGITDTPDGTLTVQGNTAVESGSGLIVENSLFDTNISVTRNSLNGNTNDGLLLQNSDGVLIKDNTANGNGDYGYHADLLSSENIFKDNVADANGVGPLLDENGGNCGGDFGLPSHCP
jgi:nitrous oxidase accessory protein